jgi:hypothetical protein
LHLNAICLGVGRRLRFEPQAGHRPRPVTSANLCLATRLVLTLSAAN